MHSLPAHAKMAFRGVYFSIYQWEQELYDGSMTTFESIVAPDSAFIIAIKDGKVCILSEEQPHAGSFLSLPGGVVEIGEDTLLGAQRELREEAGLESDDWELVSVSSPGKRILKSYFVYVARNCRDIGRQGLDAGEKISISYLNFDEYLNLAFNDEFRNTDQKFELLHALYSKEKYAQLHTLYFGM